MITAVCQQKYKKKKKIATKQNFIKLWKTVALAETKICSSDWDLFFFIKYNPKYSTVCLGRRVFQQLTLASLCAYVELY